jgi:exonuclease SbcC
VRPLELTLEGFKSYATEQVFTFDGRSLFAIVGPTGAGKSTILEAMMYALYGKTHREQRDTRDLIRTGADSAKVRLSFETDSGSWEVTRVLRRKQPSQAVLTRLGSAVPEETGQTAVTARIEELVGLDFPAFCSSVILPQGQFDKFLMATEGERSKILKGIFRLDRVDAIRERAKVRLGKVNEEIAELRGELRALPADPTRLAGLRIQLAAARERAEAIRAELGDMLAAERTLEQHETELDELVRRTDSIDRALAKVPTAKDLSALETLAAEQEAAQAETKAAADVARAGHEASVAALEAARKEAGDADLLGRARELDAIRKRVSDAIASMDAELTALTARIGAARQEASDCAAGAVADAQVAAAAEVALRDLERRHQAHVLRGGLVAGDACPVCEQVVPTVPQQAVPEALESARREVATARSAAERSAGLVRRATESLAVATEAERSARARLDGARTEERDARTQLEALLGPVADPTAEIARRSGLVAAASGAEESARLHAVRAEQAAAHTAARAEALARQRRGVAAILTELSGPLGFAPPDIEAGVAELRAAAAAAAGAGGEALATLGERRTGLLREAREATERLGSFRIRFGLRPQGTANEALADTMTAIGTLGGEIELVGQAITRAAAVEQAIVGLASEGALYERLVADMTNHKLTAYLLDADRRLLSSLGSEKLFELTAGRYRFDDDGTFQIIEARTDGKRAAGTLSGGETFLASLALALALGEAVSRTGGRLGCFFLDEGFGSLDSESLALALEGIESLAGPGRLIGLISHVGGIQSELEDLIVLDKDDDGRTIVVQVEGAFGSYPGALI